MIETIISYYSFICLSIGTIFLYSAVIGLIRFPDVYCRLHASTKGMTGGALIILLGLLPMTETIGDFFKILLILTFYLTTSPIASHAIARASKIHQQKIINTQDKQKKTNRSKGT